MHGPANGLARGVKLEPRAYGLSPMTFKVGALLQVHISVSKGKGSQIAQSPVVLAQCSQLGRPLFSTPGSLNKSELRPKFWGLVGLALRWLT